MVVSVPMGDARRVDDLDAKISLLLLRKDSPVKTNGDLQSKLPFSKDYLSRIRSGGRTPTEDNLHNLSTVLGVDREVWYDDLERFGAKFGFGRRMVALTSGRPLPGIDFAARIKDKQLVQDIGHSLVGYWESFYFSVSVERRIISCDLLIVRGMDEDAFFPCSVVDGHFEYSGIAFPITGKLYFILEKDMPRNEIIFYAMNLPDRIPPVLFGIISCLSGGVDATHAFPSAAKVVFRPLGDAQAVRQRYGLAKDADHEQFLRETVPRYIDPEQVQDSDTLEIIKDIDNTLSAEARPLALRMTK